MSCVLAVFLWSMCLPTAAVANFPVVVNGISYEITFLTGTFNELNVGAPVPLLQRQPWWGKPANTSVTDDARDFRDAFVSMHLASLQALTLKYNNYYFVWAAGTGDFAPAEYVSRYGASNVHAPQNYTVVDKDLASSNGFVHYFAVATLMIPEIDGTHVSKIVFLVMALHAGLTWRRGRRSEGKTVPVRRATAVPGSKAGVIPA